jgi:drug/metabolite transporter (DMT)-like permease
VSEASRPGSGRPLPITVALAFVVLCLVWGEFPVAAKVGIEGQPPFLVAGARFTLAGLLLGLAARARGARLRLDRRQFRVVLFISLTIVGIPSAVFFWGAQYAQVSVLNLVWSVQPLILCLMNIGDASESQSLWTALGLLLGLAGVALVMAGGGMAGAGGWALAAELAVAASALVYSVGFQQIRRQATSGSVLVLTAWQLFLAGLFNLLLSLAAEHRPPVVPGWSGLSAFAFLVLGCGCLAYSLTNWLVRHLGTVRTGYNALVTPAITVLLAAPQLGEPITGPKILGLLLVIVGLALVMPRARPSAAAKSTA